MNIQCVDNLSRHMTRSHLICILVHAPLLFLLLLMILATSSRQLCARLFRKRAFRTPVVLWCCTRRRAIMFLGSVSVRLLATVCLRPQLWLFPQLLNRRHRWQFWCPQEDGNQLCSYHRHSFDLFDWKVWSIPWASGTGMSSDTMLTHALAAAGLRCAGSCTTLLICGVKGEAKRGSIHPSFTSFVLANFMLS
jgi:hypothetical protein